MAYAIFGGSPADITTDATGNTVGGVEFQVYTQATGGTRITDLVDEHGSPLPSVVVSNRDPGPDLGRVKFGAPDTYYALYLDRGYGDRWQVVPSSLAAIVATAVTQAESALLATSDATADPTGGTLARRDTDGAAGFSTVTLDREPVAPNQAATRRYVDTAISAAALLASASIEYGHFEGVLYQVTRIKGGLRPGVVGKTFGGGFEDEHKYDADLKPVRETLRQAQSRTGAAIIANASGWRTTGNIGELRGPQIINGEKYHEFDHTGLEYRGANAIGFRADGSVGYYSALEGDTADSMLDDGVVSSFSFGPRVLRQGGVVDLSASIWSPIRTQISARQILATHSDRQELMIITITGVTNGSGITPEQSGALALAEGAEDAVVLDGGGSAQTRVSASYSMPSTDAGCERPVPDFLTINALINNREECPWMDLPLTADGKASPTVAPMWRFKDDELTLNGTVDHANGTNFPTGGATIAQTPLRPARQIYAFGVGAGRSVTKLLLRTSGEIVAYSDGATGGSSYAALDAMRGSYLS